MFGIVKPMVAACPAFVTGREPNSAWDFGGKRLHQAASDYCEDRFGPEQASGLGGGG